MVTIQNITLSLDQVLEAVRQLDGPARVQVARVLSETKMDAELGNLIEKLAKTRPADDVSDADIKAEIQSVRDSDK